MSPRNGVLSSVLVSLCWMRPARKFVSPSLRRIVDSIVRVPNDRLRRTGRRPPTRCAPRSETSTVSLSVTSRLWCTRGSIETLMPTSWYWNEVTGANVPPVVAGVDAW